MAQTTKTVSVIKQIVISWGNKPALFIGSVLGGIVPVASYQFAHNEVVPDWQAGRTMQAAIKSVFVLAALLFSAKSVYQWTSRAFADSQKATGWVVLVEGAMLLTDAHWLSYTMCGLLVAINTVATGCNLALQDAPKVANKGKKVRMATGTAANDNSKAARKAG